MHYNPFLCKREGDTPSYYKSFFCCVRNERTKKLWRVADRPTKTAKGLFN